MADDVGAVEFKRVENCDGVRHCGFLTVSIVGVRYPGGRIAAGGIGDATVCFTEMRHLRVPGPVIAREFMDEQHGLAGTGLLEIK